MFYNNLIYKGEIKKSVVEAKKTIKSIEKENNKQINKAVSEITIALIIRVTGKLEQYFDDIMLEFAKSRSSIIFYKYFTNHFTGSGKNISPEKVNGLLKILDIDPIRKDGNLEEYTSLESLYNIRNHIVHEDANIQWTFEEIIKFINYSVKFMDLIIKNLDKSKLE